MRRITIYGPLIQDIRVLQRAWIHKGKKRGKRVRRSKLYYLMERDPGQYTVKYGEEDKKSDKKNK